MEDSIINEETNHNQSGNIQVPTVSIHETSSSTTSSSKKNKNNNRNAQQKRKKKESGEVTGSSSLCFTSKRQLQSPEEITSTPKKVKDSLTLANSETDGQEMECEEPKRSIRDELLTFRMAIMPYDYPDVSFSDNMIEMIEEQILERIDKLDEEEEAPTFMYRRYERGYFKLACVGKFTRDWLIKEAAEWKFFDKPVKVLPLSEVPQPPVYRVWIPGTKKASETILSRLSKQNKGLDTAGWKLKNAVIVDKGFVAFLEPDPAGIQYLRSKNFLIFYAMTQIKFSLANGNSVKTDEVGKEKAERNGSDPTKITVEDPASMQT